LKEANNNNNVEVIPPDKPDKPDKQEAVITAQKFEGPIPHPEILRMYGEVVPDAPERILKVFELDSQHTREMQMTALKAETARDIRAQWMAFIIIIAAIGLTAFAIKYGNSASAIIASLATLFLALRVLFFKKEKEPTKNETNDQPG
jgi:uncharacterized membrane protein